MNYKTIMAMLLPAFLLLQLPLQSADFPLVFRQDFEKKYSKTFDVNGSGNVRLENRYGSIVVETWERDEVRIDVRIKVSADDQEDADKTFDRIEINMSGGGNSASATTSIGNSRRSSKGIFERIFDGDWSWGGNSSNDFKVYYSVKMPASASLETEAKYCDVTLPDLSGDNRITVGYGDLVGGDLTGANEISISYGSARLDELGTDSRFRIRYSDGVIRMAGDLKYDGRYSETRIGRAGNLDIDAGYEELEIDAAKVVRLDGNYNEVDLDRAERVFLDGNYSDFNLGTVELELEVDASYGDLEIDNLKAGFERVYIRANYIDVEIDIESGSGYEMDLRARYGDISYDRSNATNVNSSKEGSSESVTGTVTGRGKGRVDISTSYGDIELY
ncbi:DUF4097 family beta strand repeat-containing protein [Neolewinella agarilytica]|uniref:Putative adhesin n=1 Tax=Neolewinella agarilytica TaxID=478744 RepID=A0A1H9N3I7_9BACT|nr:DUF4097 family beta strand repeat-containing protein [Neolewinella agarilytica]SER30249.1 Putative adhesin [Neolewinella agarilytica]